MDDAWLCVHYQEYMDDMEARTFQRTALIPESGIGMMFSTDHNSSI